MLKMVNCQRMKNGSARSRQTFVTITQRRISISKFFTLYYMLKKLNRETASGDNVRPVKVLQFGEGNFLRAFADWIIDTLNEKTDFNGAVQIIQPIQNGMGKMVNDQDGLYHVVLNGIQNGKSFQQTRLISSVVGVINPFENLQQYLQCARNPHLKFILSNTTEAGIIFSANDTNPKILPETFPG